MYSESDIEAAVASGALSAEAAAALRDSVAQARAAPAVDEESFRLLTGFNDIFVTIAAVLLLWAVGWIVGQATTPQIGSLAVAASSWGLAEYFTRQRRMALPSILLLVAFALGMAGAFTGLFGPLNLGRSPRDMATLGIVVGLLTAAATWLHWRRFHVPVTIAALTAALVAALLSAAFALFPAMRSAWLWVLLAAGLAVFAFAMWWDMSDRARTTRRSDVAFWLHLGAAPMIAHPIFWLLGITRGTMTSGTAVAVVLLYLLFGLVALAVDRRALLVSSLVYVLYALQALFRAFGAVSLNVALTALLIGSALLTLSALWHPIRRAVVLRLPAGWARLLPELDRPLTPRPT